MPLVDYADSDSSDVEEKLNAETPSKEAKAPSKPALQKVVDRSNPYKIRVSLPELSKNTTNDCETEPEPPSKRPKINSGGSGGFNSLLPSPKRAAAINGQSANNSRKGRLGSGVSLKTGAVPAFSRDAEPGIGGPSQEAGNPGNEDIGNGSAVGDESTGLALVRDEEILENSNKEPKKHGNPIIFKPLSVARKAQKKKKTPPTDGLGAHINQEHVSSQRPKTVLKTSLFSIGGVQEPQNFSNTLKGEYKPMVYQALDTNADLSSAVPHTNPYYEQYDPEENTLEQTGASLPDAPQSLDTIAADLNLSASAKRQLFGRNRNSSAAAKIVNFNTDQEYAANEVLRQNGDQVQHNPVRALAAGKHSLKQLVNAASNQKDALEEQFATGRRNKREAGSKYGW